MGTNYPGGIDTLATNKSNTTPELDDHPAHHNDMAAAIMALEQELGTLPKGSAADVKTRLNAMQAQIDAGAAGADNVARASIAVIKEGPLNIEHPEYGATTALANNTPKIQAALNAAAGTGDVRGATVLVPPNREYAIQGSLDVPTGVTLQIEGALVVDPAMGGTIPQVLKFQVAGGQGFGGGVRGHGRILCNRKATNAAWYDCWRHADWRYIEIDDPIDGTIVMTNSHATQGSDSHHFDHVFLRTDPTGPRAAGSGVNGGGFATDLRPLHMFEMDSTGAQMISDSTIINCQVTGAMRPTTITGGVDQSNGGVCVLLTDCQRIKVRDMMVSDNSRRYSGSVKIVASSSASNSRNSEGNVIDQLYQESQATTATGWVNRSVQLLVQSGSAKAINFTQVLGLRANQGGWSGGKKFVCTNNGTGQIRDNAYLHPRCFLDDVDQITVTGTGVINNHIQLMRSADATGGQCTLGGDSTNKYMVMSGASAGFPVTLT